VPWWIETRENGTREEASSIVPSFRKTVVFPRLCGQHTFFAISLLAQGGGLSRIVYTQSVDSLDDATHLHPPS
jgi:hypothetical protein